MAGILIPDAIQTFDRLFTAADLAVFPTHLPSGDVDYELDHGRLIVMVPPGETHGSIQASIAAELIYQGQRKGYGRAYGELAIVLSRDPDTVLGADAAFIGKAKLPVRNSREGYLETIPDLVVEILSENDTLTELERKASKYLAAGVGIVLIADPEAKTIAAHHTGAEPRIYLAPERLALDKPIPGFRMNLGECFSESAD